MMPEPDENQPRAERPAAPWNDPVKPAAPPDPAPTEPLATPDPPAPADLPTAADPPAPPGLPTQVDPAGTAGPAAPVAAGRSPGELADPTMPIPIPMPNPLLGASLRLEQPAPRQAQVRHRAPARSGHGDAPAAGGTDPGRPRRAARLGPRQGSPRLRKPYRRPGVALPVAVTLALLAAFFGWQAAEPWWLAWGYGSDGTATVTRCDPRDGSVANDPAVTTETYRCVVFQAAGGGFEAVDVTLLGAGDASDRDGTRLPARMISAGHDQAYAASPAGLHLRWSIGLLLVLACGAGIAWVTGATRLDERRSRRRATLLSFAGPLLLTAGFTVTALL